MHDPLVVAFEIPRPWPQRSGMARGRDRARWRIRLKHTHHPDCAAEGCTKKQPFPWWRPRSYSRFWVIAGRTFYWPPLVVIWHREPGGADSGTVCKHWRNGRYSRRWKWHVWHWHLQVPPLQQLRRRLLTRCTWCQGKSRKGDRVNTSLQWDRARQPWWRGEQGLYHGDCSGIATAHAICLCDQPVLDSARPDIGYGECLRCGKFRPYGITPEQIARDRVKAAIPEGARK